ncbi:trimeric intracellular cation channel family protein [Butyrivibrio sp. CB08]|uniref:trimeric intracellular cation channel family protein n=1 Tax=Butyrivibrio sp. CB08 TaxID=2364879 RepID=UPI000EA8C73D|nr:TRIC cation channel family protein [Butyrivibrio sp. CB08]RKM56002.1 trimeric intracellular cation channel family protein [Butyrivibrio sp. CB08]
MNSAIMFLIENIGIIAFALSGAVVAAKKDMDIFGINLLAMVTATGGGLIRDIIIDNIPPAMFVNPQYTVITLVTANIAFLVMRRNMSIPKAVTPLYDSLIFWLDTLGLAAFTVDGAFTGINSPYGDNLFLVAFLGIVTGIGGGIVRDVFADSIPAVLTKHVYAIACIAGSVVLVILWRYTASELISSLAGFFTIVIIRFLAMHFKWNLPTVNQ